MRRLPAPAAGLLAAVLAGAALLGRAPAAVAATVDAPAPPAPTAAAPFLVSPVALPAAIDPVQPYVGQTSCDPTEKPGARALLDLLVASYPGSTDAGIVHTCAGEGARSEHSEGRALDWGVSVHDPAQKAEGDTFVAWLFAAQGAVPAVTAVPAVPAVAARRLGVMYVIWDGRIREASGDWRPYLPAVCWVGGAPTGDDTTCHRDHVHVSLGWSGAWQRTSFWTGGVAPLDYGPCIAVGAGAAPAYTVVNPTPCANTAYVQGGSIVAGSAPVAVAPAPVRSGPTLSIGAHGVLVVHLQRNLRMRPTGTFGPATQAAVAHWQRAHRLAPTGIVAGLTWTGLHPVSG